MENVGPINPVCKEGLGLQTGGSGGDYFGPWEGT